jgi:arsenate reductase
MLQKAEGRNIMNESKRKRVLFICTHNSARSQMAEGIMNHIYHDKYEAHSAGTKPTQINPLAIRVMMEIGVDISGQRSKRIREFDGQEFDYVVTLCSDAEDICPFFPGKEHMHRGFEDPGQATGSDEDKLNAFRKLRGEIGRWIEETFKD